MFSDLLKDLLLSFALTSEPVHQLAQAAIQPLLQAAQVPATQKRPAPITTCYKVSPVTVTCPRTAEDEAAFEQLIQALSVPAEQQATKQSEPQPSKPANKE